MENHVYMYSPLQESKAAEKKLWVTMWTNVLSLIVFATWGLILAYRG